MQQAIPYKSWLPLYTNNKLPATLNQSPFTHTMLLEQPLTGSMADMVSHNTIIVFARRGCCMTHVVKRLLLGLGVDPPVYEIDDQDEQRVSAELDKLVINSAGNRGNGDNKELQFPAVFVAGKLFGGLERLVATHISGELVPILKEAGVLWL